MTTLRVAELFVYPLKGGAGVAVDALHFDELAVEHDRRWMLVDMEGIAITQRDVPSLARVTSTPGDDGSLLVRVDEREPLRVEAVSTANELLHAIIWKDNIDVADCGDVAAAWFSDFLEISCRLVTVAHETRRALKQKYSGTLDASGRYVALSDGAPALVLGTASMRALNDRLLEAGSETLGVERFRPNIVVETSAPHEEDAWAEIEIGNIRLMMGSLCPRCTVPTIDQVAGRRAGVEPLRTLATYRRVNSDVLFAVNATHVAPGTIQKGDNVTVAALKQ